MHKEKWAENTSAEVTHVCMSIVRPINFSQLAEYKQKESHPCKQNNYTHGSLASCLRAYQNWINLSRVISFGAHNNGRTDSSRTLHEPLFSHQEHRQAAEEKKLRQTTSAKDLCSLSKLPQRPSTKRERSVRLYTNHSLFGEGEKLHRPLFAIGLITALQTI